MLIINLHLIKRFLISFAFTFLILLSIVFLVDMVAIFNVKYGGEGLRYYHFILFTLLRLPNFGEQIITFCVLIASIHHFLYLSSKNEINIYRTNGYSIWLLMIPYIFVALFLGIFFATVYNPLSSKAFNIWEEFEVTYFTKSNGDKLINFSQKDLWVRSNDGEYETIINAASNIDHGITLLDVKFYRINKKNKLDMIIRAPFATLKEGYWEIKNASIIEVNKQLYKRQIYHYSTNFCSQQIKKSFSSPSAIPIWELSAFIKMAETSGIPAYRYSAQLYKLLLYPLTFFVMILIAMVFCIKHARLQGKVLSVSFSVILGIFYYFTNQFASLFFSSEAIPLFVLVISPSIIFLFVIFSYIFYFEER